MSIIVSTSGGVRNALTRQDFAATAFKCNAGNLLEPTVYKNTSLVGNGSFTNPLGAKLSTDGGNSAVFGTDGGIYVPPISAFSFSVAANSGPNQPITSGNTLTLLGGASLSSIASATDIVTFNLDLSSDVGQNLTFGTDGNVAFIPASTAECPAGYFIGAPS